STLPETHSKEKLPCKHLRSFPALGFQRIAEFTTRRGSNLRRDLGSGRRRRVQANSN
ncbi:hypothetical protein LEMLEM_LOCUS17574, partial [Lemmus lemmus]